MTSFAMSHTPIPQPCSPQPCSPEAWVVHVVDDDPAVCNALKFSLEIDGFCVRTYTNSGEFLSAHLPPGGCVIVDYNLPGINGLELLTELDRRAVHLPAFLITTDPAQHVRRRAIAQGVSIIEKPLLGNQLSEAIKESYARARAF